MKKIALHLMGLLSLILAVSLLVPQRAAADDDDDPPSRVARLAYASGSVSFEPAGTDDWVTAVVNRPVTTGDKLWSDNGSRAELNIGNASIRLSSNTGFSFLNLTDNITQIRLTEGTLRVRVKNLDENETFEIDTPNLAFSVLRTGTYRINVNEAGDTTIIRVLGGEGEVTGGGQAYSVKAEQTGTFTGTDQIDADIQSYGDDDDFDNWCEGRDRHEDRSISAKYVSTDVIGYDDLDDNGGWRSTPDYGTIWFPHTTIIGWAPYRYGHWAYIAPWGYTWVDDAPWGFAPFHYGRWVTVGGVWGWVPCPPRPRIVTVAYVRPVYAPALVAWVGGAHFGVGFAIGGGGGGNVGWFPLGPREVYVPSYHVSRNYVNNVNISNTTVNTTVINNYYNTTIVNKNVTVNNVTYINQSVPGAVTATSARTLTTAQPVSRNIVKVDAREVATAPVAAVTPGVAPERQAVLGSGAVTKVRPPATLQNRAVVAKIAPPPAPVAFAKQQQAIQANGGRPIAISQQRQLEPQTVQARPNIRIAPPAKQVVVPQNTQGNRPVQSSNQPPANTNNRPAPVNPSQPSNTNRPGTTQTNVPNNQAQGQNQKNYNDRPVASRPTIDPQLEQKQQQQQEVLRQKQDQERQRVEQQQLQQQQKLQQKKQDDQKQQQIQQQQQQKLEQLERKHDQEQQKLQQKQQQEVQKVQKQNQDQNRNQNQAKPPREDRPDRPHGRN